MIGCWVLPLEASFRGVLGIPIMLCLPLGVAGTGIWVWVTTFRLLTLRTASTCIGPFTIVFFLFRPIDGSCYCVRPSVVFVARRRVLGRRVLGRRAHFCRLVSDRSWIDILSSMSQWSARIYDSVDNEPQALQQLLNYGSSRLRAATATWEKYNTVDEESMLGLERLSPESQAWWTRNIWNETVSISSNVMFRYLMVFQREIIYVLGRCAMIGYMGWLPEFVHLVAYDTFEHPLPYKGQPDPDDPTRVLENYHEPWWKSPLESDMIPWADQPKNHILVYKTQVLFSFLIFINLIYPKP